MAENTKKWDETGRRYRSYIKLEKRLSENTVESYMRDYMQFAHFILRQWDVAPHKVEPQMVERYMAWLYERGREKTSQARALSGIKSFFNFLMISDKIESSPAEFVLTPKFGRQLPDVLTTAEIDRIIAAVDTSTVKGLRDCAMLEVLYSCGLRVSELTSLRMQDLFFGEGYIRVIGKGDKQRIVPVSSTARDRIQRYLEERRSVRTGEEIVFLNNRGGQLTRVMVFTILKQAAVGPGSKSASAPTPSATRSRRTCWKAAPRSVRCRRCWGTKASSRPKSTPTSTANTCGARSRSIYRYNPGSRKIGSPAAAPTASGPVRPSEPAPFLLQGGGRRTFGPDTAASQLPDLRLRREPQRVVVESRDDDQRPAGRHDSRQQLGKRQCGGAHAVERGAVVGREIRDQQPRIELRGGEAVRIGTTLRREHAAVRPECQERMPDEALRRPQQVRGYPSGWPRRGGSHRRKSGCRVAVRRVFRRPCGSGECTPP